MAQLLYVRCASTQFSSAMAPSISKPDMLQIAAPIQEHNKDTAADHIASRSGTIGVDVKGRVVIDGGHQWRCCQQQQKGRQSNKSIVKIITDLHSCPSGDDKEVECRVPVAANQQNIFNFSSICHFDSRKSSTYSYFESFYLRVEVKS